MERSHVFEAALVILIILLAGLLYLAIVSTPRPATAWEIAGNDTVEYMFLGSNDTLYTFSDTNITAINSNGCALWTLTVPHQWQLLDSLTARTIEAYEDEQDWQEWVFTPVVDENAGYLYLYLTGSGMSGTDAVFGGTGFDTEVVAVAPNGTVAWRHPVLQGYTGIFGTLQPIDGTMKRAVTIKASGDRVYLFHNYEEDVLDNKGNLLFTLTNVSAPVSIDASGNIYAVRLGAVEVNTLRAMLNNSTLAGGNLYATAYYRNGVWNVREDPESLWLPSSNVDAYDSNGTLLWSRDIGEGAVWQPLSVVLWQSYNAMPAYVNDTLYVPLSDGIAALGTDGNVKWISHIPDGPYELFELMPFDAQGYVYMEKIGQTRDSILRVIDPEGNLLSRSWNFTWDNSGQSHDYPAPLSGKDGIVYAIPAYPPVTIDSFNDTVSTLNYSLDTIVAIDVRDNSTLWSFQVPYTDRQVVTINRSIANEMGLDVLDADMYENLSEHVPGWAEQNRASLTPSLSHDIQVYPGDGVTYVSYSFGMYDPPLIFNLTKRITANGLYAIDRDGQLLWENPSGAVGPAVASNRTLYYASGDQLGSRTVGVTAAGLALAAVAYLFLRFFMLGTVARARGRLESNENRVGVLRYVAGHPGLTATDLARELRMNKGTIRYHLFILTLNHKIVTHREDDRYLRYFRNSGAYSREEQMVVSLLRREPLRRTLRTLSEKPGLSGSGLARELGISPTAANRHIALLAGRGIVEQVPVPDHGYGYVISEARCEQVRRLLEQI